MRATSSIAARRHEFDQRAASGGKRGYRVSNGAIGIGDERANEEVEHDLECALDADRWRGHLRRRRGAEREDDGCDHEGDAATWVHRRGDTRESTSVGRLRDFGAHPPAHQTTGIGVGAPVTGLSLPQHHTL